MNLTTSNFSKKFIDSIIKLKCVNKTLFEGAAIGSFNLKQLFGGTLVGQAISVGYEEVSDNFHLHNIIACYIKKGTSTQPLQYQLKNVIKSNSFNRILMSCTQNENEIASFILSFKIMEPSDSFVYNLPHTVQVPFDQSIEFSKILTQIKSPTPVQINSIKSFEDWLVDCPFTVRLPDISIISGKPSKEPIFGYYFQLKEKLDDLHNNICTRHALIGFMTDYGVLYPIIAKHSHSPLGFITSLDHSLWFHSLDFDINQQFFMNCKCLQSGNCLSLNVASVWTEDNKHIATIVQEGLIREQVAGKGTSTPFIKIK